MESNDTGMELLRDTCKRYFNGDWSKMLSNLKFQFRNKMIDQESKDKIKEDIEKIEIYMGLRPESGFNYLNGHCRIPANLSYEDFSQAKAELERELDSWLTEDDTRIKEDNPLHLAVLALNEIGFMINRVNKYSTQSFQK